MSSLDLAGGYDALPLDDSNASASEGFDVRDGSEVFDAGIDLQQLEKEQAEHERWLASFDAETSKLSISAHNNYNSAFEFEVDAQRPGLDRVNSSSPAAKQHSSQQQEYGLSHDDHASVNQSGMYQIAHSQQLPFGSQELSDETPPQSAPNAVGSRNAYVDRRAPWPGSSDARSEGKSPEPEVEVPVCIPLRYSEGFCRPYYAAERIAGWVLQTVMGGSGLHGHPAGLLTGQVHAARGLHVLFPAAPGVSLPDRRVFVRVCLLQASSQVQDRGEGSKGAEIRSNGRDKGLHQQQQLQGSKRRGGQGGTAPFEFEVSPGVQVNPITSRRTPVYRSPVETADPDTGTASWKGRPDGDRGYDGATTQAEGKASEGDGHADHLQHDNASHAFADDHEAAAAAEVFVCTLGWVDDLDEAAGRGSSVYPQAAAAAQRRSVVDEGVAEHGVCAQLEWDYLRGYLLVQLFEEHGAGAAGEFGSASFSQSAVNCHSGSSAAATKNVLLGQSVLRLCDLFAAATMPYDGQNSSLYRHLHQQRDGSATMAEAGDPHASAVPAQQFNLNLWLPITPTNPRSASDSIAALQQQQQQQQHRHDARGARHDHHHQPYHQRQVVQPAVSVSLSLVLPHGIVVPRELLAVPARPAGLQEIPELLRPKQQQQQQNRLPAASPVRMPPPQLQAQRLQQQHAQGGYQSYGSRPTTPTAPQNKQYRHMHSTELNNSYSSGTGAVRQRPGSAASRASAAAAVSAGNAAHYPNNSFSQSHALGQSAQLLSPQREHQLHHRQQQELDMMSLPAAQYYGVPMVRPVSRSRSPTHHGQQHQQKGMRRPSSAHSMKVRNNNGAAAAAFGGDGSFDASASPDSEWRSATGYHNAGADGSGMEQHFQHNNYDQANGYDVGASTSGSHYAAAAAARPSTAGAMQRSPVPLARLPMKSPFLQKQPQPRVIRASVRPLTAASSAARDPEPAPGNGRRPGSAARRPSATASKQVQRPASKSLLPANIDPSDPAALELYLNHLKSVVQGMESDLQKIKVDVRRTDAAVLKEKQLLRQVQGGRAGPGAGAGSSSSSSAAAGSRPIPISVALGSSLARPASAAGSTKGAAGKGKGTSQASAVGVRSSSAARRPVPEVTESGSGSATQWRQTVGALQRQLKDLLDEESGGF